MTELNPCRWRSLDDVGLVCTSPRYVGAPLPVRAEFCAGRCYYPDHAPGEGPRRLPLPLACVHRGGPTGETRPCLTCTGELQVPVLACALHAACTRDKLVPGLACCLICRERQPPATPSQQE